MSVLSSDWFTGWTVGDRVGWSVSLESGFDLDRRIINVGGQIIHVKKEISDVYMFKTTRTY